MGRPTGPRREVAQRNPIFLFMELITANQLALGIPGPFQPFFAMGPSENRTDKPPINGPGVSLYLLHEDTGHL